MNYYITIQIFTEEKSYKSYKILLKPFFLDDLRLKDCYLSTDDAILSSSFISY